jgi:putative SOS response-associated peptidase YedK
MGLRSAGIWTNWSGVRGSMKTPREGEHDLYALLTCDPNRVVGPIHPKAMPVILTTEKSWTFGCARRGMRQRLCSAPFPTIS